MQERTTDKTREYLSANFKDSINPNLLKVCGWLRNNGETQEEAKRSLLDFKGGHRELEYAEVERATSKVYNQTEGAARTSSAWALPKAPKPSEVTDNIIELGITPIEADDLPESPEEADNPIDFIRHYFHGLENPCVYIGHRYHGGIETLGLWTESGDHIEASQYDQILANPMQRTLTPEERQEEASGGRKLEFASETLDVITFESDTLDPQTQLGVIAWLAKSLPLVSIVHSGGKSYHATYSLKGLRIEQVKKVRQALANIGGDPAVMSPVQLVRLGGVHRSDKGNKFQTVLYIDPYARCKNVSTEGVDRLLGLIKSPPKIHRTDKGIYYMENQRTGNWQMVTMPEMRADLSADGLTGYDIDAAMAKGRHEDSVSAVIQLGGRSRGMFQTGSGNILVPRRKHGVQPREGSWTVTRELIKGMFYGVDENKTQLDVFMGWLARAWQSYTSEEITVGQFLHIAGDAGSYKTYLVQHVLANLFGVPSNLNSHLVGDIKFNSDLFTAFLWVADDASMKQHSKVNAELIKSIAVASQTCRLEAKNVDPITVPALRRGIMLTNTGEEAMKVIPVFEEGMDDKVISLFVHKFRLNVEGINLPTEQALQDALRAEAPAFAYVLENYAHHEWNENHSDRYGVPSYKNPLVLEAIREASPEARNHELIMRIVWRDYETTPARGERVLTSTELMREGRAALADGVIDFFGWESTRAIGKALSRITSELIESKGRGSNTKKWLFKRPSISPFEYDDEDRDTYGDDNPF